MNKESIIVILLALVVMAGQAQTIGKLDSQKVVPSMTAKYGSTAI